LAIAVWVVIAALVAMTGGAAAKDHGAPPPGHAPGKSHGPPPGHAPHGNGHRGEAPPPAAASTPPPQSTPAPASNPPTPADHPANSRDKGVAHPRAGNHSRDGSTRRLPAGRAGRRLHTAVHALLPLEELGASAPAARGGSDPAPRGGKDPQTHARNAAAGRTTGNDGKARPRGGSDGALPFTGLALLTLVLTGAALVLVGGRLHRSSRPAVAGPAPPPVELRPEADPIGAGNGRSPLFALALAGLVGVALIAVTRRPA
jgi:hypothetical protein